MPAYSKELNDLISAEVEELSPVMEETQVYFAKEKIKALIAQSYYEGVNHGIERMTEEVRKVFEENNSEWRKP